MPVCLCLCTFIEIRRGTKNLDLVLCTVVYIGLGKTSVTIWTISSVENWGNHWGKWTILRSFQDHMGDPAWWHWGCNLTAYTPPTPKQKLVPCASLMSTIPLCKPSHTKIEVFSTIFNKGRGVLQILKGLLALKLTKNGIERWKIDMIGLVKGIKYYQQWSSF